jgi:hypothetical protein
MIDSDFWRDLAVQFHSVDKYDHQLAADWNQEIGGDHVRWELRGADSTKSEFDPLARRGAIKLASASSTDLLSTWLDAIKREMPGGDREGTGYQQEDTGEKKHFNFGKIQRIGLVSAQLCKKFESRSLEKERLSALRQPKPTSALVEHATARYAQNIEAFRREKENRFADVMRLDMSPLGRAVEREKIIVDILTRQITERIRIYGKVAEEESCSEMLAKSLLDKLREEIMTGVRFARISLVERNEQDARAAGQFDQVAFEASRRRLEVTIEPTLLSIVAAEFRVLETSPLAPNRQPDEGDSRESATLHQSFAPLSETVPAAPAPPTPKALMRQGDDSTSAIRRSALLDEYRAKTEASNRRIYEACNSCINKPEFYQWLRGELPQTSKTTI